MAEKWAWSLNFSRALRAQLLGNPLRKSWLRPCTCNNDYLAVYDGEDDQARRLGNFCGDAFGMRGFRTLYSSGRYLYLKFKSDGKNQKKGFHLQYQTFLKGKSSSRLACMQHVQYLASCVV